MATIAPASPSVSLTTAPRHRVKPGAVVAVRRRRKLSREAGQAIEKLAHAIDYLNDEFGLECMAPTNRRLARATAHMDAVELLMARNREIYLACPEVLPLTERLIKKLRALLRLQPA